MPGTGRNQVAYDELQGERRSLTVKYDNSIVYSLAVARGSVSVGLAVKWVGEDTVGLATDGSGVVGKLELVDGDGFCTVKRWGTANFPSTGTVTRGTKIVGAAAGTIRSANSAVAAELLVAKGEILSVADTANVWVDLGG